MLEDKIKVALTEHEYCVLLSEKNHNYARNNFGVYVSAENSAQAVKKVKDKYDRKEYAIVDIQPI